MNAGRRPTAAPTLASSGPGRNPLIRLARNLGPLARWCLPYRRLFIGALLADVVAKTLAIGGAAAGAYLIGRAGTGAATSELWPLVWLIVGVIPVVAVAAGLHNLWVHVLSYRLLATLRIQLYDKLEELAPAFLVRRRSGDLTATALADVELLEVFTSHLLPPAVVALVVPTGALVGLGIMHPLLPIVVFPFLVAVATVPTWLLGRAASEGEVIRTQAGELSGDVVDILQGQREIATFDAGDVVLERLDRRQELLATATAGHGRRSGLESAASDALLSVGVIAVVVAAAVLVDGELMSAALFPAAVVLAGGAFAPITAVSRLAQEMARIAAAAERVLTLLRTEPAVVDFVAAVPDGLARDVLADATVRFEHVTFSYGPDGPPALDDVSFIIPAGGTTALVGHSGAGKSTCSHLLLRYWDPDSGRITIGGHDLRDLPQAAVRDQLSLVPQDTYLFGWTVADNVRVGAPEAGEDAVRRALSQAQAVEFVDSLPDGMATMLGERGTGVSGGQRQRLAIARALLRDAPVVILDEAVSNLDSESERALQAAYTETTKRRTTLVIAHRPSTMKVADHVVVLERGRVVESGTYAELRARDGALTRLLAQGLDAVTEGRGVDGAAATVSSEGVLS